MSSQTNLESFKPRNPWTQIHYLFFYNILVLASYSAFELDHQSAPYAAYAADVGFEMRSSRNHIVGCAWIAWQMTR